MDADTSLITPASPAIDATGVAACLEFMLPESLSLAEAQPALAQWSAKLSTRVGQFNGRLDVIQPNVLWLFFDEADTSLALRRCLKALWPVMAKPLSLNGQWVTPRLGLAKGQNGNPYQPRSKAMASQCVLPADMAALLPQGVTANPMINDDGTPSDDFAVIAFAVAPSAAAPAPAVVPPAPVQPVAPVETPAPVVEEAPPAPVEVLDDDTDAMPLVAETNDDNADTMVFVPDDEPVAPMPADIALAAATGDSVAARPAPTPAPQPDGPPEFPNRFDVPIRQYSAPAAEANDEPAAAADTDAMADLSESTSSTQFGLTAPASEPMIPEVVSQRYSVNLPQEPVASGLPVFPELTERATALPSHVAAKLSSARQAGAGSAMSAAMPFPRKSAQMGAPSAIASSFEPVKQALAPTHTYSQVFPSLVNAVRQGLQTGDNMPRLVTLAAPGGVGKSVWLNHMLLQELVPNPEEPAVIWFSAQAACGLADAGTPLGLWTDLFQKAVPMPPDGVDGDELEKWIQQSVDQVFGSQAGESHFALVEALLYANTLQNTATLPMVTDSHMATPALLADFYEKMAQKMPVVIVLDDLHRADAASIQLLTQVWQTIDPAAPVVWVTSWDVNHAPSGILAGGLNMVADAGNAVMLTAGGVDEGAYEALFTQGPFAGMHAALLPTLRQKIYDYARQQNGCEGSLLYISEVLTWLHAQGALHMDNASGEIAANPEVDQTTLTVPPTLDAIYENRLGWLSPEQQDVLAWCATMGERFSVPLLSQCCSETGGLSGEEFSQALQTLAAQQWVLTDFQQSGQFRHPSLWAFAYKLLHDTSRKERHQAIAAALEHVGRFQHQAVPMGWLAWQATQAGQTETARSLWQRVAATLSPLNLPAAQALALKQSLGALQQAASQYEAQSPDKSGSVIPQSLIADEMAIKTQLAQTQLQATSTTAGDTTDAEQAAKLLPDVVAYYQHTGNRPALVEALGYLMVAFERIGHVQGALEVLDACLDQLGEDADPTAWVALQAQRACILYQLGQYRATQQLLDEPLIDEVLSDTSQLELSRLRDKTAHVRAGLSWRLCTTHPVDVVQALSSRVSPHYQPAMRIQQAQAQLITGNAAGCEQTLQHIIPTIQQHERSVRLLGEWGYVALQRHRIAGNITEAEPMVLPGLQQAQAARDYPTWVLINLEAAKLALSEKRFSDALDIAERMAEESSQRRLAGCALASWHTMASIFMDPDYPAHDMVQAQRIAQRALDIAQKPNIGYTHMAWQLTLQVAQCQLANGALQDAGNHLQPLWPHIKASGYAPLISQAARCISQLYGTMAKQQANPEKRAQQEARAQEFAALAT